MLVLTSEDRLPRPMIRLFFFLTILCTVALYAAQQSDPQASNGSPTETPPPAVPVKPEDGPPAAEQSGTPAQTAVEQRTQLNLVGQTDTRSGESRRNENVQLTPLDTNLLKDLNERLGTTATIVTEFSPERSYFSTEYGNAPSAVLHVPPVNRQGVHGRLYESHLNSVFSSRSFFQVGDVLPARENDYGVEFLAPLWRNSSISLQGNQQKIRGMVNGNVLVLLPGERTPLATDPATRAYIQRIINGYPAATPNRPDIGPRMLNANSAQRINGDMAAAQLDQAIGARDHLTFRHQLVFQQVDAFQLVAGQNPDTTTRSHQSRFTWNRQWRPATLSSLSLGFDRVGSLLVTEPNNVGPSFSIGGLTDLGPNPDIPTDRADNVFRAAFQVSR